MKAKIRVALCATVVVALTAPVTAQAKTVKIATTAKLTLATGSGAVGGTFSGKPFGKGKVKGKSVLPLFTLKFSGKGGGFTMLFKGAPDNDVIKGKFTLTKGTGKYKGIKGSGTGTGTVDVSKKTVVATFKYKGTAKY